MENKSWIVCLKNGASHKDCQVHPTKIINEYKSVINGFCCECTEEELSKHLDHSLIESICENIIVKATVLAGKKILSKEDLEIFASSSQANGAFIRRIGASGSSELNGNGSGSLTEGNTNLNVFVVDTGIYPHQDLNIVGGRNFVGIENEKWTDLNGHGTHVSGIIGAKDNEFGIVGVAPGVRLWAIRVLDKNGSGTVSSIINGLNWIIKNKGTIWNGNAIVNMSLGGGRNAALDTAVGNLIQKGIVVVVAAGNSSTNALNSSPARVPNAVTVGATAPNPSYQTLASYSNFGSVVDVLAPGTNINSTYLGNSYASLSGTSMATPVVAGTLALMISTLKLNLTSASSVISLRNSLINNSSATKTRYFNGGAASNPRVQVPATKATTTVSVWAGLY